MSIKVESTSEQTKTIEAENKAAKAEEKAESKPAAVEEKSQDAAETTEDEGASEESESDESESEEKVEGELVQKKPLKGFKKRIDKLSKRVSATEQERDYWREQAMKGQKPSEQKPDPKTESKAETTGKPKADDFNSHEEFVEALTDWKVDQKDLAKEQKQKAEQVKTEQQKQFESYSKKSDSLREVFEDYDDVMESVDDINMSLTVQQLLLESENGPELGYDLAKNKREFARICSLNPVAAAREFGKFEAQFNSSKPTEETKTEIKTTKTPAPIKPVGTNSASANRKSIHDPNLSQREYEALREKQRAARGA